MLTIQPGYEIAPDGTAYDVFCKTDAPVVVLIHGLGLCRHMWRDHIAYFAADYQVVSYDLLGHGDSVAPTAPTDLSLYARQLCGLLDHLQIDKAAVVGFSIGGMINRRFALDYADRLSALAILNSPHDRGDEAQTLVEARAVAVRSEGAMATMEAALERWFTDDYRTSYPDFMETVRVWRRQVDAQSYAEAAWVLATGVKELTRPTTPVNAPTIVITSENDSGSTPDMAGNIAREIDQAEIRIVPELKHLGLMEQPQSFTVPVIEFFRKFLL
jgi:(E)-2-((N-methylformamido)methylene)succinate hydrolase